MAFQLVYALFTGFLWLAWHQTPAFRRAPDLVPGVSVSVVVVVRNEEANLPALLDSLLQQSYPVHLFDVYIVDDFSTDDTVAVVSRYRQKTAFRLHLLQLKDYTNPALADGSFKKRGIEWAVSQSTGELIVTTDGDCVVPPHWLTELAGFYEQTHAQMICGGVTFTNFKDTIFSRLQTVEFASLIGSGAATLRLGLPTMCNAANLAFTREAFVRTGGYRNTASTATGDDLFLMHKIYEAHPGQVLFLKSADSTVCTQPQETLSTFYQQRKRWASKWRMYQDWRVSALAVAVFLCNLSLLAGFITVLVNKMAVDVFFVGSLLRWCAEWLFVGAVLRYFNHRKLLAWMVPVQVLYPLYVLVVGLAVQKKGYYWKGRKMTNG